MNVKEMKKIQNIVSKYRKKEPGIPTSSVNTITDSSKLETFQNKGPSQTLINKFLNKESKFEKIHLDEIEPEIETSPNIKPTPSPTPAKNLDNFGSSNNFQVNQENSLNYHSKKFINVDHPGMTNSSKKFGEYESSNASVDALDQVRKLLDNNNSFVKNTLTSMGDNQGPKDSSKPFKIDDKLRGFHDYKNLLEDKILQLKLKADNNIIQKRKLNPEKLIKLPSKYILSILEYINLDFFQLWTCNKLFHDTILCIMREESKKIIDQFKHQFRDVFLVEDCRIMVTKVDKQFIKQSLNISLNIKAKIVNNLVNKTVTFGYKVKKISDGVDYLKNIFKFDVKAQGPMTYWVMREYTSFHQDDLNKAYIQHIMQFNHNDVAELNVNLYGGDGLINFDTFQWLNKKLERCPDNSFLEIGIETKSREVFDFDLSRVCELEIMKNKWNDISKLDDCAIISKKIKNLFDPSFLVNRILFDDVGYLVFKIFLVALTPGVLKTSNDLGITLKVVDVTSPTSNEVKKNCLLYDRSNELQIRIGDILIFYISRNKM